MPEIILESTIPCGFHGEIPYYEIEYHILKMR